jgi:hypothetical protein
MHSGWNGGTVIHQHNVPIHPVQAGPRSVPHGGALHGPSSFGGGWPTGRMVAATHPPAHHGAIVNNHALMRSVHTAANSRIVPGTFHWHHAGGVRFCHTFFHGTNWFGFWFGPTFFWTQWWGGWWWWWDPIYYQWAYWYDGYWWWNGPGGVPYVYVDGAYYPYNAVQGGVTTTRTENVQPPPEEQVQSGDARHFDSPDGSRRVDVTKEDGHALLYDTSSGKPEFLRYMAANVTNARFSNQGGVMSILLDFSDGTFALFDKNGKSLERPRQEPARKTAPPEPLPSKPPKNPPSVPPLPSKSE